MRLSIPLLLSLSVSALGEHNIEKRQEGAAASKFSSAAHQLVSLYIPSTVLPALASVASAHSVSGTNILSILESAFTATITPDWFTAIPTQYSTNIVALESKIEELRGAAIAGSISGAPRVLTSIDGEGKTIITTSLPTDVSSGNKSGAASSSPSGTLLSGTRTTTSAGTTTTPVVGGSGLSSSSGIARATQVPAAVMGVIGLFGAIAAL